MKNKASLQEARIALANFMKEADTFAAQLHIGPVISHGEIATWRVERLRTAYDAIGPVLARLERSTAEMRAAA